MKTKNFVLTTIIFLFLSFSSQAQIQTEIKDADNDTKIETERTADEDEIRFSVEGTEVFKITGNTLENVNSGNSVFIGQFAGANDDLSSNNNLFIGRDAGTTNTSGDFNVALGFRALRQNLSGSSNMALGANCLENSLSKNNVGMGSNSMRSQTTGANNVGLGLGSGFFNQEGSRNVFIGTNAGRGSALHNKDGSVLIGFNAGFFEEGSNKLYIANSNTSDPLLYGEFDNDLFQVNGDVVIGEDKSVEKAVGYRLSVDGKGIFTEVRVLEVGDWPDYVFLPEYDLRPLEEVKAFIDDNGHLPSIPSAKVVEEEGIALGNMQKNLLEKVEEMTLYMIQMNDDIKSLKSENETLKKEIESLKNK